MGRNPFPLQPLRGTIQDAIAARSPRDQEETLVSALKVCGRARDFQGGKALHAQATEKAPLSIFVVNALIDMYAKCGSMADARNAFDTLIRPNVMSWNVLMLGYVANGESGAALDLFERMQARRSIVRPNARSFMAASMACSSLAAQEDAVLVAGKLVKATSLDTGRGIHSQAKSAGCCDDLFLATKLIDMFAKCGSMDDARSIFDEIPRRDAAAWNALLLGFVDKGESAMALELFDRMDCAPNARSFVAAIKACASEAGKEEAAIEDGRIVRRRSLDRGLALHDRVREFQCCGDLFVASALVDMYSRCGSVADARSAFEGADRRDVVLWTSMIQGLVDNGESERAIALFEEMRSSGCAPNARTLAAAISAVASAAAREGAVEIDGRSVKRRSLEIGSAIHRQASGSAEVAIEEDVFLANALIEMYSRCGNVAAAREIFDGLAGRRDAGSWNAMIRGASSSQEALELFAAMAEECDPDERSLVAAIAACSNLDPRRSAEKSRELHAMAATMDLCRRGTVGSALIALLARCGRIDDARAVFQGLDRRDVVAWTSLIQGLVENGDGGGALEEFDRMGGDGCEPNARTLSAALAACALAADREAGRRIQAEIHRRGALEEDPVLPTSVVDFHSKCGDAIAAERWFGAIAVRDAAAWNALIAGLDADRALAAYGSMREEGARPTAATLASVIAACGHAGMVDRGRQEFERMRESGIEWGIQHYGALIDMYGRANRLEEALAAVERLRGAADAVVWRSLLGACAKWKNVGVARIAFQELTKLDEKDPAAYVLMASVCRSAGLWEEHDRIRRLRGAVGDDSGVEDSAKTW